MNNRIKIVILSPTAGEIDKYVSGGGTERDVKVDICGVGMLYTACKTMECIEKYDPDLMILAGIAGAYPDSGLAAGDVVTVEKEYTADMGSFANGVYRDKFKGEFRPYGMNAIHFCEEGVSMGGMIENGVTEGCTAVTGTLVRPKPVSSNTVNCAGFPFLPATDAAIENMEGAAFFYVCGQRRVRCVEIRAISNIVGQDMSEWDIPLAATVLAEALTNCLKSLSIEADS